MKEIHLTQEEIEKYPLFYHGKSNEAEIREYNSQELLKIFHFYNQNKIDTLKCKTKTRKFTRTIIPNIPKLIQQCR